MPNSPSHAWPVRIAVSAAALVALYGFAPIAAVPALSQSK
jgi:hypothetical protein